MTDNSIKNEVTVILNGYKRGNCLDEQYESLISQTFTPSKICLWYNHPEQGDINYNIIEKIQTALSNVNLGVWARFAYALTANTEYVCIFDDDMIPGKRWIENCVETIKTTNGLLGAVGLRYVNPNPPHSSCYYEEYQRFGWIPNGQSDIPLEVDLVGHIWFFKREWLSYYWRELPNPKYFTCGEDMHFSYMLQKYAGIKTYVAPHPISEKEKWGNIDGGIHATDRNSMWETNQESPQGVPFKYLMNEAFIEQRKKGWKLINERI